MAQELYDPIPEDVVHALALEIDTIEDIAKRFEVAEDWLREQIAHPNIRRRIDETRTRVYDRGEAFAARCRVAASGMVAVLYEDVMHKPDVPVATKLEVFRSMAKYGGLEPENVADKVQAAGTGFRIQIVLPDMPGVRDILTERGGSPSTIIDVSTAPDVSHETLTGTPPTLTADAADNSDLDYRE